MQILKNTAAQIVSSAACELFAPAVLTVDEVCTMLEYPPDGSMGDLALPCFKLSKSLRRSPMEIASKLAEKLSHPAFASIEAVGGYLNFKKDAAAFAARVVNTVLEQGSAYGAPNIGNGKTVVLDYSSPNVAKPFHIGHLGTTVIGHAQRRLHEFAGYKCIGINHLGDWGTQFGKLIVAYKKWGNKEMIEQGGIDKLVELYVMINNAISGSEEKGIPADPALADASRAEFRKLELGDEENLALWRWFIEISLAE